MILWLGIVVLVARAFRCRLTDKFPSRPAAMPSLALYLVTFTFYIAATGLVPPYPSLTDYERILIRSMYNNLDHPP